MRLEKQRFKTTPMASVLARHYRESSTSATRTFSEKKMTADLLVLDQESPISSEPLSLPVLASRYQKGENSSGLHPLGRAVLLWPLETGLKTTKIQLPDSVKQRQLTLDTIGWVVEMGSDCDQDSGGIRCKVGDPVIVAALAGSMREGKDGVLYRFVRHMDIYGLVDLDHPLLGDEHA